MADWDLYMMPRVFKKQPKQSKSRWALNCERHMQEERDKLSNGKK